MSHLHEEGQKSIFMVPTIKWSPCVLWYNFLKLVFVAKWLLVFKSLLDQIAYSHNIIFIDNTFEKSDFHNEVF